MLRVRIIQDYASKNGVRGWIFDLHSDRRPRVAASAAAADVVDRGSAFYTNPA
jgi:hypothetical protein